VIGWTYSSRPAIAVAASRPPSDSESCWRCVPVSHFAWLPAAWRVTATTCSTCSATARTWEITPTIRPPAATAPSASTAVSKIVALDGAEALVEKEGLDARRLRLASSASTPAWCPAPAPAGPNPAGAEAAPRPSRCGPALRRAPRTTSRPVCSVCPRAPGSQGSRSSSRRRPAAAPGR